MKHQVMEYSVEHPRTVFALTALLTLLAALFIPRIVVDTDPENMLPHSNAARLLHEEVKQRFGLSDMIVVGIVNEDDANGVYNPATLTNLHKLSAAILNIEGVVDDDLMSLPVSDNITQKEPGEISFHWMMEVPPTTQAQAEQIRSWVARLPMLQNTLVSGDNKAAGIYIPITAKDQSYRIYQEILSIINGLDQRHDEFHITGLPVAEDTFGVEMFKQMAISAPAAGALIFMLMLFFFRSAALVTAPMLIAMATVIITMGVMIGMGFPVHIMSSMIPIFLMPIAVVDSVHMLSEFNDKYRPGCDKKALAKEIVGDLFQPMLYTSITSVVGFASLNTADIPPVRVFGSFIAIGIALAFLLTITFVPAYMASLSDATLDKMSRRVHKQDQHPNSALARLLRLIPGFSLAGSKLLMVLVVVTFAVSGWGISKIVINDNPMNWFEADHPIRNADVVLNNHFAGTYEAYLSFDASQDVGASFSNAAKDALQGSSEATQQAWQTLLAQHTVDGQFQMAELNTAVMEQLFEADTGQADYWDALAQVVDKAAQGQKFFLQPENVAYLERVQQALAASGLVGKTSALPDLLKTVNRELLSGEDSDFTLPQSANANAQAILTYQSSHRPNHVWHMVTPDYRSAIIWLQLTSGDNQDMSKVVDYMENWFKQNPMPQGLQHHWSGLTYINVIWQDAMVTGMLESLASSFIVVALMMIFLFRSVLWGIIAMLPLSVTISFIYGLIGITGKNYDMPVAVLSALTLGMSIDFAIHFIERTRALVQEKGSWRAGIREVFEEPGRAISRNAIVIALGFTPLLIAPLVPYQTVGIFLASIMAISCLTTLVILPAIMHLLRRVLFKELADQ